MSAYDMVRLRETDALLIGIKIDASTLQRLLSDQTNSSVEFSQLMMRTTTVAYQIC